MAAITHVQSGDAQPNTGVSTALLSSNTTIGNAVALFIIDGSTTAGDVSAISSPIGTFVQVVTQGGSPFVDFEWWVCPKVTGAGTTATLTIGSGSCSVMATEWTPIGGYLSAGPGTKAASGTAVSLTATPPAPKSVVLVGSGSFGTFSAGPTTPWVDYDTGGFTWAGGADVAWQTTTSRAAVTATWTQSSNQWQTLGLILTPPSAPVIALQAVQRAAFRMERAVSGLFTPRERERVAIPQLVLAR